MEKLESITFDINDDGDIKKVIAKPHPEPMINDMPESYEIAINGLPRGKIKYGPDKWTTADLIDENLVKAIGEKIQEHYGVKR